MNVSRYQGVAAVLLAGGLLVNAGCDGDQSPPDAGSGESRATAGTDKSNPQVDPKANQPPPPPSWTEPLREASEFLGSEDLDRAATRLADAKTLLDEADAAGPARAAALADWESLTAKLETARDALAKRMAAEKASKRAARLSDARELQESGKLDEATAALDEVLAMAPDATQRETIREMKDAIETHRAARRRLGSWMKMLASQERSEVRAAQNQLRREPENAIPLLLEAVRSPDKPRLVKNTLEMLRRLRRPGVGVPAMVGVLSRAEQASSWPDAVREISRLKDPGAGPLLLPLLSRAKSPAHRTAVLAALAAVPDPPPETLPVMVSVLHQDGPELVPALRAAYTAMTRHGQDDLLALRGLPADLDEKTLQKINALPERLVEIAGRKDESQVEEARAARMLAVLIGVIEADVLAGVKVVSATANYDKSLPTAVLDGKWDTEDVATGWQHVLNKPGTIILDLGTEKTVTAVRVWNYNGQGQRDRGWKEVDVFVSKSRTDLTPEFSGIIPRAPGANDQPDFSIVLPVDQVNGRYVILKARSLWSPSTFAGLSEIQVIGY